MGLIGFKSFKCFRFNYSKAKTFFDLCRYSENYVSIPSYVIFRFRLILSQP